MRKSIVFLSVIFAAMALAPRAKADSRIDGMSSDPRVTDDVDIIWMFPNQILNYSDKVDFRLNNSQGAWGDGLGEWGGVTKNLTDLGMGGVLGVYLNRPFAPSFGVYPTEYWIPTGGTAFWSTTEAFLYQAPDAPSTIGVVHNLPVTIGALTPTNKVDVFWADHMGGYDLGIKLNYGDNQPNNPGNAVTTSSNNGVSSNNVDTARTVGLDLGVGMKSDYFSQVNFHGGYSLGSFQDSQTYSDDSSNISNYSSKDNGIYTATADALLQHDFNPDNNVRLFGDWSLNQFAATDVVQDSNDNNYNDAEAVNYSGSSKYDLMVANLGLGMNHKFNQGKGLLTSGLLVSYWSSKQTANETDKPVSQTAASSYSAEEDTTTWDLSWNTGMELQVSGWLTLRAGIAKSVFNSTDTKLTQSNPSAATQTDDTTGDGALYSGVQFHMGFGINFEDLVLNTVFSAQSLEQTIANVQPGNGIFFDNKTGTNVGPIVTIVEADLSHPI
jgi:hypothetical protein